MPKLNPEDQKRVDEYLRSNVNDTDRKPFNMWLLLGCVGVVLVVFTIVAWAVGKFHGVS